MKQYTDKEILEIYQQLPEDLKKAIFGVETAEAIKKIGEKYQLHIDKIGILGNETGMVMVGITRPNSFIDNLAQRLDINKETAGKIGEEISAQIFAKVRESLKKIHGVEPSPPAPLPEEEGPGVRREDILKEIEKDETNNVPEIIKGVSNPEEKKYISGDPYREPIG